MTVFAAMLQELLPSHRLLTSEVASGSPDDRRMHLQLEYTPVSGSARNGVQDFEQQAAPEEVVKLAYGVVEGPNKHVQ